MIKTKECKFCGKKFISYISFQYYCSIKCRKSYMMGPAHCLYCNNIFYKKEKQYKFCSMNCFYSFARNKKEKKCSHCEIIKEITNFHKDKSRKDGVQGICKECRKK